MRERSPNLEKDMDSEVEKTSRVPNRHDQKNISLSHYNENYKTTEQRILKAAREKQQITCKIKLIRITSDLSA
jgi:uncharacterized membrane protein